MSLEDDLINRIRALENAKWQSAQGFDYLIKEYEMKLSALRSMRAKENE